MPYYRSKAPVKISFEAGDQRYTIMPDEVCDIDRRYAYVIAARGLPLVLVDRKEIGASEEIVEPVPVPKPVPKRVKGVASGMTVLESDDGDDRVGEVLSPVRAALMETLSDDDDMGADAEAVGVPLAVAAAVKSRGKKD